MICPNCRSEFAWHVTACRACGADLVERLPSSAPRPTPDAEVVPVFQTGDPGLIAFVKSLLDGEGIPYIVRGDALEDLIGGGRFGLGYNAIFGPAEFSVGAGDAERARELLAELALQQPEATPDQEER